MTGRLRRLRLVAAALALFVGSACQLTITAGVDTNEDGSGEVRAGIGLDRDAVNQVPDLANQLKVDDLRNRGWVIVGPRPEGDGLTWVRASKEFFTPAEARQAVAELNGPEGPFREFKVSRERSLFKTTTRFSGTVDLSGGVEGFSDDELKRRLSSDSGVDVEALKRRFDIVINRVFKFQVAARLPGSIDSNAPVVAENGALWRPKVGQPPTELRATGTSYNAKAIVLAVAAVVAFLAAVVVVAMRVRRWRRRRRPVPA